MAVRSMQGAESSGQQQQLKNSNLKKAERNQQRPNEAHLIDIGTLNCAFVTTETSTATALIGPLTS